MFVFLTEDSKFWMCRGAIPVTALIGGDDVRVRYDVCNDHYFRNMMTARDVVRLWRQNPPTR